MARDKLSYTCKHCGTVYHIEFGSVLRTECPACWETWDVVLLYRAIRPKRRRANCIDDGVQGIPDELKRKWTQLLPQFNNFSSWTKLDGFDLAWILCLCPECVRQVPLKKLDSEDWHTPLQLNEMLLRPFWTVSFGSSSEISNALRSDPSLIEYVDVSQRVNARNWWSVLDEHPYLVHATPVSYFADLPTKIWVNVLKGQPQSWVESKAPWDLFSGSHWAEILPSRPELATQCPWRKLGERDWNAILLMPSSAPAWSLIHDVLCGRNLLCLVKHTELLKYLDWDLAPLMGLRELIIASNLEIQPPSWNELCARIVGEKSYWQYHKSVQQFIPPIMPVSSGLWTDESLKKADFSGIIEFENRLALLCFMGWDLVYFASGINMEEMNAAVLVKYPWIGQRYGWDKLPVEMHYEVIRTAPWLREHYPWTEWPNGKLKRLFASERAFMTEYRKKYPFKYIFIRFGYLIFVALVACIIGAGLRHWRYAWTHLHQFSTVREVASASGHSKYIPDSAAIPDGHKPNELIDLPGNTNSLTPFADGFESVPAAKNKSSAQSSYSQPYQESKVRPVQPEKTGAFLFSAFAIDSIGKEHPIKTDATLSFSRPGLPIAFSTNAGLPGLLKSVPSGEYSVTITATGFQNYSVSRITIAPDVTNELTAPLCPNLVKVHFLFPSAGTVFDIYDDARFLGTSATSHECPWFVPHYLTFKAKGWRDNRVKVQLPEPGKPYRCTINMERVASQISISVTNHTGALPEFGLLSVNGRPPAKVNLPAMWPAVHATGAVSLALSVEGFNVLNSPQQAVLVDRTTNSVIFIVDKKPLVSRLFGR